MTQCEILLDYLREHGSVTGMDSINMGVMNYKGRINDLRRLGYPIKTVMESKVNAKGEKKTYARYILGGQNGRDA
jgi:hypothetical protein